MKVIKTSKRNWIAVSADGRVLSDGYPKTTPAAARRAGEQIVTVENMRKNSGGIAAIKWILENI